MEKVKGLVIAPYEGLKQTFLAVAPDYADQIDLDIYVGNLQDGLEIVKTVQDRYDIIISRGGTATLISSNTDKIVIDVRISGYDFMRIFKMVENVKAKKAMVGYENVISGANSVNVFMQADVDLFTITSSRQLPQLLKDLMRNHYDLIIGDTVACKRAEELNINNLMLISGEESVRQSVEDAIKVARKIKNNNDRLYFLQMVQERSAWSTVVLNSLNEIVASYIKEEDPVVPLDVIKDNNRQKDQDIFIDTKEGVINIVYSVLNRDYIAAQFRKVWAQNVRSRGVEAHSFTTDGNELSLIKSLHSKEIIDAVEKIGKSSRAALFIGDTGAGKLELAEAVHRISANKRNPFFEIDCSVISEEDLDNLFSFMHLRKGTLCFVSLECLDDKMQKKLYSKLPLINRSNMRIIGVANTAINNYLADKTFDARLYRAFAEYTVHVPNLSESKKDIKPLIAQTILKANQAQGRQVTGIDTDAMNELERFKWVYNYDQLNQAINQLVMMARDTNIHLNEVREVLASFTEERNISIELSGTMDDMEKQIIEKVIRLEDGNVTKAAERLNIGRSTIWRKVK